MSLDPPIPMPPDDPGPLDAAASRLPPAAGSTDATQVPDPSWTDPARPRRSFAPGEVLELRILDLAYGGAGVGRADGLAVFVAGALPGELVRCRLRRMKGSFGEADLVSILEQSPDRVEPRCAHFGACGGCQSMNLAYEAQLRFKQKQVRDALSRIGGIEGYRVDPIAGSPAEYGYRNRMDFDVSGGASALVAGLHAAGDPSRILEIRECHLQGGRSNEIRSWIVERLRAAPAPAGFFRRLTIRTSGDARDVLLVLETAPGPFPDGPAIGREAMRRFEEVRGVLRRIVDASGIELSIRKLAGEASLRETISGLALVLTAGAFLQVNTRQAARLYAKVEELADVHADERLLDLYCGVGSVTLLLGRSARRAVGVDLSGAAVRCAEANARANGLAGCSFLRGDARRVAAGMAGAKERYEAIVVNPPRVGLPAELIGSVSCLGAGRIVYVSCNPATLARDLGRFAERGYRTTRVAPFDMFPQTYHIETVARLERV